jgi:hypothetical protein
MKHMEFLRARRSAVLTITFVVMACLIIGLTIHILNGPANAAKITTTTPSTAQTPPPPKPVTVNGAYASFSYPDSMHSEASTQASNKTELATYVYAKSDIESWRLAIAITQLESPSLDSDDSYTGRVDEPSEYKETTVTYGNNTFMVMTDLDAEGFGEVAYILHGNTDATIALTGDDASGTSGLETTFQQVLQSWQWR